MTKNRTSSNSKKQRRACPPLSCRKRSDRRISAWQHHDRRSRALEPYEREMPKRRDGTPLNEAHAWVFVGPIGDACPGKLRSPAETPRERSKAMFEGAPKAHLRAQMISEDDLTAGLGHAHEFVERPLGVWHSRDHELCQHDVEGGVGKTQTLCIHDR